MKFDLKKYPARLLPYESRQNRNTIVKPGVGTFFLRSVGNTSYTTAMEVYLHRERRKNANYPLGYYLHITDDGHVEWRMGSLNWAINECQAYRREEDQKNFPSFALPIVHELLNDLPERDPTSFMFFVHDACNAEIRRHAYKVSQFRSTIELLSDLLNPDHYKDDAFSKLPMDKLTWWLKHRNDTMTRLTYYFEKNGERWNMLQRISRLMSRWSNHSMPEYKTPLMVLIDQAVAERSPRKAPPMVKMWD